MRAVRVHQKQGAAYGYTKQLGYHPLLATQAGTGEILHARMRKGSAGSSRGVVHFVDELLARVRRAGADGQNARAFCRLFAACVRAARTIMFEKTFGRSSRVSEGEFPNELERLLREDPELNGRLSRRDPVAGGFDDLLHDDVIAELKVSRGAPATVDVAVHYLGQPTRYGVGRGSQLSVIVVFDHGRKEAPPGMIDDYIAWLKPSLHGLTDARYPSLVGVLIVNTYLPIPSAWSRRSIQGGQLASGDEPDSLDGPFAELPERQRTPKDHLGLEHLSNLADGVVICSGQETTTPRSAARLGEGPSSTHSCKSRPFCRSMLGGISGCASPGFAEEALELDNDRITGERVDDEWPFNHSTSTRLSTLWISWVGSFQSFGLTIGLPSALNHLLAGHTRD